MKNKVFYTVAVILLGLMLTSIFVVFHVYAPAAWVGYVKPSYLDYAPSGMPDFDEKQPMFTTDIGHVRYSWCAPVAVANSLWWLDSQYESINYSSPVPPPTISDHFNLVTSYGGQWDDHDPQNVYGLVAELATAMHTDGIGTPGGVGSYVGTKYADIQPGINTYLTNHGVAGSFEVHGKDFPDFSWIEQQVETCQDVELCLEFMYFNGQGWQSVSEPIWELGHCVTCAGINSITNQTLVSDPYFNAFEAGLVPGRSPVPHVDISTADHNNASKVSQDAYSVVQFLMAPPPGYPANVLELQNYLQINDPNLFANPNWHAFIRGAVATSPLPDIAVTNVTTSKTGCHPFPSASLNFTVKVQVTVANHCANQNESDVNVTAYADAQSGTTLVIGSKNVTLNAGSSANVTFTWNLTSSLGVSYGNYTLRAYAANVTGETNTGDNNFTDGKILVTIPGDINGDFNVNISDLTLLAKAYHSKPGDKNWNPNANFNDDDGADISDLTIMARHYNTHYP